MENGGGKMAYRPKDKIFQIFSDFMASVTEFEELVAVGNKLVVGFQQGLDFLRRPPINKKTKLVERIIEANKTKRVLSYFGARCANAQDSIQNISKLHTCQLGLLDNLTKAKCIINKLECLLEDALQTLAESFPCLRHEDTRDDSDPQASTCDKEENEASNVQTLGVADYAGPMGIIYSMLKQDYLMQEKIVSSLNLKSSSGELETYCLMWSLRPFIDDEIMHKAWRLVP